MRVYPTMKKISQIPKKVNQRKNIIQTLPIKILCLKTSSSKIKYKKLSQSYPLSQKEGSSTLMKNNNKLIIL